MHGMNTADACAICGCGENSDRGLFNVPVQLRDGDHSRAAVVCRGCVEEIARLDVMLRSREMDAGYRGTH